MAAEKKTNKHDDDCILSDFDLYMYMVGFFVMNLKKNILR